MDAITKVNGRSLDRLHVVARNDGCSVGPVTIKEIGPTHVRFAGTDLPIEELVTVEVELFDDLLRMHISVLVEQADRFGFSGRFVDPGKLFATWISSMV